MSLEVNTARSPDPITATMKRHEGGGGIISAMQGGYQVRLGSR